MHKKPERTKLLLSIWNRVIFSRFFRIGTLFIGVIFAFSLVRNIITLSNSEHKVEEARKRLESIQAENQELKKEVEKVENDSFKEKQARDKLGLAKENEVVVVLPDEETLKKIAPRLEDDQEDLTPLPNWQKWLKLFVY